MKSLLILFAAALAPLVGLAQTPAPSPSPVSASPSPAPAGNAHDAAAGVPLPGQPAGPTLEKNIPLIPETAPHNSRHSHHSGGAQPSASPKLPATFQTEQDVRTRVRLREAATKAMNKPAIEADWAAAQAARADTLHRQLLRVYYNQLYDAMIKIEPTLAERINARRDSALTRMKYTRLGEEDNSADPFVAPLPAPSGPNPPASDSSQ